MKLQRASLKAIQFACKNFHYSKAMPVNPVGYSVFNAVGEWCGVVIFGNGANPNLAQSVSLRTGQVAELTRMALNGKQESTSKAMAIAMKLFRQDNPLVQMLFSFADQSQGHVGTIYQATNWYYTGIGKSTPNYFVNGRWIHQRQLGSLGYKVAEVKGKFPTKKGLDKYRYIYPLNKELIALCQKLAKPYPKKQNAPVV